MIQRDVAINSVLLVLILAVSYLLVTYRRPQLPTETFADNLEEPTNQETRFGPDIGPPVVDRSAISNVNPWRTIITPTPTPTPTPPTPTPPLDIRVMMAQFQFIMPDPGRSMMMQDKAGNQFEWKIGETRKLSNGPQSLDVTLRLVDPNDFHAEFTAPPNQIMKWSIFGGVQP